jgi:hypothetical protein
MSAGQVESSFQWVFVLLAGAVFITFFFMLIRGCVQQGEERTQGLSLDASSLLLERTAWQPDGEVDLAISPSDVSCRSGVLTLSSPNGASPIDRAPAFLSPTLSGQLHAVVRRVEIRQQGVPPIPLGSALLGFDDQAYYLVATDATGGYPEFEALVPSASLRRVGSDALSDPIRLAAALPKTARTAIIVSDSGDGLVRNAAVSAIPDSVRVLGVSITEGSASFFSRAGGAMVAVRELPAEHPLLAIAAAVCGDPALYACSHAQLEDRALRLAALYEARALAIADNLEGSACEPMLRDAAGILNSSEDLAALLASGRDLSGVQFALVSKSCPVIA